MRIRELDGLRGIAVLAVIDRHYFAWLPAAGSAYGWLGVDLFFVLSGFLITSILLELRNKKHYFKVFYSRRALRIFPPYFLGIGVYLVISLALGKPGTLGMWLKYIFYYASLVAPRPESAHFVASGPPLAVVVGLVVAWSLSVEEIYYTIWAPIVRFTTEKSFSIILAGMIVTAPLLRWFLHTPGGDEVHLFYCRMDALAFGSVIALLSRFRRILPQKWASTDVVFDRLAILVLFTAIVFWLVLGGDPSNILVSTLGLVLADLSFALVIYALIRRAGGSQLWVRVFRARWLCSIGMVSYSLYLFHYPLLIVSEDLVRRISLSRHIAVICSRSLALGLSFAVAYGLWYGMESRILRWKDRKVPSPAHPNAPQSVPMVVR